MKVLHFSRGLSLGGTERVIENLCRNRVDGCSVQVAALEDGPRKIRISNLGVPVRLFETQRDVAGYIEESGFDILHVHTLYEPFDELISRVCRGGRTRIVETAIFGRPFRSTEWRIDRHLVPSKCMALRFLQASAYDNVEFPKRVSLLYNAIETKGLTQNAPELARSWRESLGIPPDAVVAGKIGRPDPKKFGSMLTWVMLNSPKSFHFVLIGAPAEIIAQVCSLENVHLLPPTTDEGVLAGFYNGIDILAHSSHIGESFGNVIAEAMAAAKPVVVNSTPLRDNAQIELVDNDKTGLVVRSRRAFRDALATLADNEELRLQMGERARSKALLLWNAPVVAARLQRIYEDVLSLQHETCISSAEIVAWQEEHRHRERATLGKTGLQDRAYDICAQFLANRRFTRVHLAAARRFVRGIFQTAT